MSQANPSGKSSISVRRLTATALMAAMITVAIMILYIPIGAGGIIHFGDAVIYLAACLLPLPYAAAAAAIGGGMADYLLGYHIWLPFTMMIKPLTTLCFKKDGNMLCIQNVIALMAASAITVAGYYVAEALITGNWFAPVASMWGNLVQSGGSAVFFVLISVSFDRLNLRSRLGLH